MSFFSRGDGRRISANDRQPAEFLYDNRAIAANVIKATRRSEVRKLGAVCCPESRAD